MSISQNNLCVIPARGGSRRIPGKNIKDFLGKPIIAYSIETAIDSGLFSEIMVSTDDVKIAKVAEEYGAKVPFYRSEKTSNDYATLSDVIEEVKQCYLIERKTFDNICCVLPTAPLITASLIKEVYAVMQTQRFDSVRPIVKFSFPIQRALKKNGNKIEMFNPEFLRTRSQDLESSYHDAGMLYWMTYSKGLLGTNKGGVEISELIAQDIDTLEDWKLAEFKYQYLSEKNECSESSN